MSTHASAPSVSLQRFPRLVHIVTSPASLIFLRGQIGYMKGRGFDVHVICSPGPALEYLRLEEEIEVHPLPMQRPIRPVRDLISLLRLCKLVRRLRPDIVHSHTPKAGLLGTIAARAAGCPAVALSVFGLPQMSRSGFMRHLLDTTTRLSCSLAHWVWCDSHSMRSYVVEQGLCTSEKVVVLGNGSVNGIDSANVFSPTLFRLEDRLELRAKYGIPPHALVLGFVGRIVRDKGICELAAAYRTLRDRYPELHLLLVGPFEETDPLPADVHELFRSDPCVHLTGPRSDVALHLSAMDLFVNPSYREGFGVANAEASAMGLPVVSTNIPGCVDSVAHGVTGTLVPSRDDRSLAAAIATYIDDAEFRFRHGTAGRDRVVRLLQPQNNWCELEIAYRSLMHRRQGHATIISFDHARESS